jgi:hypothetical protein
VPALAAGPGGRRPWRRHWRAGPNFCGEYGTFLDGEQIENVTGKPLKGQPAGSASSSGRTPMADMSPEGRAAYLRELDVQMAAGPTLAEDFSRAEAALAGSEEDWHLAAAHLRVLQYDVSHTADGRERSVNTGGDQELAEAERVELRTRDRYDAARSRLNQLLAEFQSIDDEGPPGQAAARLVSRARRARADRLATHADARPVE